MLLAAVALAISLAAVIVVARPRRAQTAGGGAAEPGTVTTDAAEVRRQPSQGAAVGGVLPQGARVTILADRGPWLQIRAGKDTEGYVTAESVERDADRQARERRASKILTFPPVFGVVAEPTDVRLAPFPFGPRAGRLARGTTVSIHAVDHAYYAFRVADGTLAFVDSAAVDLVPPDPRQPAIVAEPSKDLKDVSVTSLPTAEVAGTEPGEGELSPAQEPPETSDEALDPPVLVSKVDPVYPEMARRAGVEGTVVLDAQISAAGRVEDVQVLRGLPLGLSESAAEAVRHWQYRPARGRSGPIAAHKTVRIVFTLGAKG